MEEIVDNKDKVKEELKQRRDTAWDRFPFHRNLTLNGRLPKDLDYKSSKLVDILLRRFVTDQSVKPVRSLEEGESDKESRYSEHKIVTNLVEFKLLGLDITLKYSFETEKVYKELKSKMKVERKRTYHIGDTPVTKEEYEAYKKA